jgi:hypothetical protein
MTPFSSDPAELLRAEKLLLIKADRDIEEGEKRIIHQRELAFALQVAGYDSTQADRLVSLLQQTLIEWEKHRTLIVARIAYLERFHSPADEKQP